MPVYEIDYTVTVYYNGLITVEADSEDEASAFIKENYDIGDCIENDSDLEINEIEKIEE